MMGAMTLKRVSRRRSEVGRVSSVGGLLSLRPRCFPATMRNRVFLSDLIKRAYESQPMAANPNLASSRTRWIIFFVSTDRSRLVK